VKIGNGVAQIMAESRQWQQIAELIWSPARNFYRLDVRLVPADARPSRGRSDLLYPPIWRMNDSCG
jgi:hypothetical protein